MMQFVSAVTPQEIARNKEVPNFDQCSSGVPCPEAVDELPSTYNPSTPHLFIFIIIIFYYYYYHQLFLYFYSKNREIFKKFNLI